MNESFLSSSLQELAFYGLKETNETVNPEFLKKNSLLKELTLRTMAKHTAVINEVREEAEGIKTFFLEKAINAKPGQFVMLWLPEFGERPFSISFLEKKFFGVTIAVKGAFTSKIHSMGKGELIGVRGPFGNGFKLKGRKILCIGGGYGTAPLNFLAEEALKKKIEVEFIVGARTKKQLIFTEMLKEKGIPVKISTNDGSAGVKGTNVELFREMNTEGINYVYSCGREEMLRKIAEICIEKGIPAQLSLEGYNRCGFGKCNSYCTKKWMKFKACKKGPVFTLDELKKMENFF